MARTPEQAATAPDAPKSTRRARVRRTRVAPYAWVGRRPAPVPREVGDALAPATCLFREWDEYWLRCPGADRLRVGSLALEPELPGLFRVQFRNQLGLTTLQPFHGAAAVLPPLRAEVLSRKFPSPAAHVAFLGALLGELYTRGAALPFAVHAPTARGVGLSPRPATALFVLHFALQHGARLRTALGVVQASLRRTLVNAPELLPVGAVAQVDAEALLATLATPEAWTGTRTARTPHGMPTHVWQRRPRETCDTAENRLVCAFLAELLAAADALPTAPFWRDVPDAKRRVVRALVHDARHFLAQPALSEVRPRAAAEAGLDALYRRDGYRDVGALWQLFRAARRPLFEGLQHAIDVRDAATLYEVWAFFALVGELATLLATPAVIDLGADDDRGPAWGARARFGAAGTLVYNGTVEAYSGPVRPDFVWSTPAGTALVLDAKFRLDRGDVAALLASDAADDAPAATALRADLYKMHAYRDALGVRAAVSLYPGDASVFYRAGARGAGEALTLRRLLEGDLHGVGALALRPQAPRGTP